jgi:hypothetical protein
MGGMREGKGEMQGGSTAVISTTVMMGGMREGKGEMQGGSTASQEDEGGRKEDEMQGGSTACQEVSSDSNMLV